MEQFEVGIVGAGRGARVAVYVLAQAGLSVVMFERGDAPRSKAMLGGVLYTTILQRLIPDFYQEEQCVERSVIKSGSVCWPISVAWSTRRFYPRSTALPRR